MTERGRSRGEYNLSCADRVRLPVHVIAVPVPIACAAGLPGPAVLVTWRGPAPAAIAMAIVMVAQGSQRHTEGSQPAAFARPATFMTRTIAEKVHRFIPLVISERWWRDLHIPMEGQSWTG